MKPLKIVAILPARMASSRFPGKPLLKVQGLSMIEHVRRRTLLATGFSDVVVATCDREIAQVVEQAGGKVVMTSPSHPAATDRVAEAVQMLDCTHVVNVQGDEILVLPSDLERMLLAIREAPEEPAWNAVAYIEQQEELRDRSIVKCVVSNSGRILFCSREFPTQAGGQEGGGESLRKVLGVLGFRRDFLERYPRLTRTPLEMAERIDQSRILEHDIPLRSVLFSRGYVGINEPRELQAVQRLLEEDTVQQSLLQEIVAQ